VRLVYVVFRAAVLALIPQRDTRRNTADPVEGAPVKLTEYQILHLPKNQPGYTQVHFRSRENMARVKA
jgi:hypothetical protein